jgi:hypothetical protein
MKFAALLLLFITLCLPITGIELFAPHGTPHKTLTTLLSTFKISAQTPTQTMKETQKAWLRPAGKERWEVDDVYGARKQELMPLFKDLGLVEEKRPLQSSYDYLLLMGALYTRAKSRLEYAISLSCLGISFKTIVILGSERSLNAQLEPDSLFSGDAIPKTEFQMMQWIFEHTLMPSDMYNTTIIWVNAPNTIDENGKIQRATTADTINLFLAANPIPGTCLVISNQPHIEYQAAVTRLLLPESFKIEGAGHALSEKAPVSEILDALARWIYQEEKLWNKAHHA